MTARRSPAVSRRGRRRGTALALLSALPLASCGADVPLGSWLSQAGENTPSPSGTELDRDAGFDGADDDGLSPANCSTRGNPGPLNVEGPYVGATIPYTDWAWPAPASSVEFELQMETDSTADGFFWVYQFGFVAGIGGLFGLQDRGAFQPDPPDGPIEVTRIAVFWIGGPPLAAELGDVPYPEARTAPEFAKGIPWTSIQVKYDWQSCRVYRLRLGLESRLPSGDRWYGAWILDTVSGVETFLGRMLAPATWGQLSTSSSMWTERFVEGPTSSCDDIQYASAIFGTPVGNDGTLEPLARNNRFEVPAQCASSRFTEFPNAVRHEVGVAKEPQ